MFLLCSVNSTVNAGEWELEPSATIKETYSNNILLLPDINNPESESITEIIPRVALTGDGNRARFRADYSLQSVYYSKDSFEDKTHNRLSLSGDAELVEDWFYIDINGLINQQLTDPQNGVSLDNLNPNSGREEVVTSNVTPRLERRLGRYVRFDASVSEGRVNYDKSATADGLLRQRQIRLSKSRWPAKLDWNIEYNESEDFRGDQLNSDRQSSSGLLSYELTQEFSLIARGGREEGNITTSQTYKNGSYWSAGAAWRLSSYLKLEATSGHNDKQSTIRWTPTSRTALGISYIDRDVGIRPSATWTGNLSHSTKRTVWTASYSETVTNDTILAIVGQQPVLLTIGGQPLLDSFGQPIQVFVNQFGLVPEDYLQAISQIGVTFSATKHRFSWALSQEKRDYEVRLDYGRQYSSTFGWHWQLGARTTSQLNYTVNRNRQNTQPFEMTGTTSWMLDRQFGRRTTVGLELRSVSFDADDATRDYREDRVAANIKMTF